ncbi:MAG: alpha/beta hydrolase [Candidatus Velthaea sp.]
MNARSNSQYAQCLGREIHYTAWGDEAAPVLVMWHGLARTGRDFDEIANALADTYRVVCPDTIGRGLSQWSPDPFAEYTLPFYAQLAEAFVENLGAATVRWLGTSMGGAIGTAAGATSLRGRITRLVLNDIGPSVMPAAIERIGTYLASPPEFETVAEFERYLRTIYKPYGQQSDAQWRRMTETSLRRLPSGKITTHYDPAIAGPFGASARGGDQWSQYDALTMPTLVLRGAVSDLLSPEVAKAMSQRGPRAQVVEIAGVGHAPALNVPEQIGVIRQFFAGE